MNTYYDLPIDVRYIVDDFIMKKIEIIGKTSKLNGSAELVTNEKVIFTQKYATHYSIDHIRFIEETYDEILIFVDGGIILTVSQNAKYDSTILYTVFPGCKIKISSRNTRNINKDNGKQHLDGYTRIELNTDDLSSVKV